MDDLRVDSIVDRLILALNYIGGKLDADALAIDRLTAAVERLGAKEKEKAQKPHRIYGPPPKTPEPPLTEEEIQRMIYVVKPYCSNPETIRILGTLPDEGR